MAPHQGTGVRSLYPLGYSWSMPPQPDLASVGDTNGFDSDEPMVNERSVRASAGLLFLLGFSALSVAFFTGNSQPLQGFAIVFLLEMGIRLGLDDRLLGMPRPTFRRERAGDMCGVLPLHPGAQDKAFALRRRYLRLHAAVTAFTFF